MTVLGIDGCRGGWVVAVRRPASIRLEVYTSLELLWAAHRGAKRAFIDVPIGLPESLPRACDGLARRVLGPRASTLFSVPCRNAVYAGDYFRACDINEECLGRRLSRQSWNLVPKIIEADRLLRGAGSEFPLYESHPELCFAALNEGRPLLSKKRERRGVAERLRLLEAYDPSVPLAFRRARAMHGEKQVKDDDLVDALVLAFCAGLSPRQWRVVPDPPERDGLGLPMRIVSPGPST